MDDPVSEEPPSGEVQRQDDKAPEDQRVDQKDEVGEGDQGEDDERGPDYRERGYKDDKDDRDNRDHEGDRRRSRSDEHKRSRSADRSRKNRSRSRDRKSSHRSSRRSERGKREDSRSPPLGRLRDSSRSRSRSRDRKRRSRSKSRHRRDRRRSYSRSRSPRRRKSQFDMAPAPMALPPPPALPTGLNLDALKELQNKPGFAAALANMPALAALASQAGLTGVTVPVHTVVRLTNMATAEEISDDEWFAEIKVDIEEESKKYGTVKSIVIPRNGEQPDKSESYGVGLVFVDFEKTEEAEAAIAKMHGRTFDGRVIIAELFPTSAFESKTWDAPAVSAAGSGAAAAVPGMLGMPGLPGLPTGVTGLPGAAPNLSQLVQQRMSAGLTPGGALGFQQGGAGNTDVRPGDWACPACNNNCFARTMMCNRCKTPRPIVPGQPLPGQMGMGGGGMNSMDVRPGDWTCPTCFANVFASKLNCFKCGSERPGGMASMPQQAQMGFERRPGDWTCHVCNSNVFASKGACFKCGTAKPGGM